MLRVSQPAPPSPDPGGITLWQIGHAARKHWVLVLLVAAAVIAAVAFYIMGQQRIYRSTTTILIDPNPPQPLGEEVGRVIDFSAFWSNKEYYATQIEIMKSRAIALETTERLGLDKDRAFLGHAGIGEGAAAAEVSPESAARCVLKHLTIEAQAKTRIVEASYDDPDPERARRILAALVETYIQHNLDELAASSQSASEWLRSQLGTLKSDLEKSELALHEFKKDKRLLSVSFDDKTNMLRDEIAQLNGRITTLRTDQARLESRLATLKAMDPASPERFPTSEMLARPMLEQLRQDYLTAVRSRDQLMASGKGENHPEVQSVQSNINATHAALGAELENITTGAARDLDALNGELTRVQGLYSRAQQDALDINLLDIEFKRLARLKDNNEKLYSMILERSKETDLAGLMRLNNIRVLDPPGRGSAQGMPVPAQVSLGALVGLLLGVLAALGRELIDRTAKSPDELEKELGVSILGVLPRDHMHRAPYGEGSKKRGRQHRPERKGRGGELGLLVHEQPESATAEAARAVRTNLLFMSPDKPFRTILVTSPGPGDGKTTVASWIAIAMAQAGHRVLLLDCDLRRPRAHAVFGAEASCTVAEAVLDRSIVDAADLSTQVPNLSCLPALRHVPNPAELLGSASFLALLHHLEQKYDRIVIDSPPIAAVTDATILSTRVDGTVLVVRARSTRRELARRAVRAIRDVGGTLAGVVMNAADMDRGGHYYYYYHAGEYRNARENAA